MITEVRSKEPFKIARFIALGLMGLVVMRFSGGTAFAETPNVEAGPSHKTILVPIPRYGFDPTEASIPWKYLKAAGHRVVFATPDGRPGQADVRMVTGQDLGLLKNVLMADTEAVQTYRELEQSPEFKSPISYAQIQTKDFDAIFLPGGHDKGMREYLESKTLQRVIVEFFEQDKPVAAICHGTLLAGRSISPKTGKSVLWGRKTTGLTSLQELTAYNLTRIYLGDYYRTYPEITMEDDLKSHLKDASDFFRGPGFPVPTSRDSPSRLGDGFTILDGNYLSARWPGDAHRFGRDFVQLLARYSPTSSTQKIYYLPTDSLDTLEIRVGEFSPRKSIVGDILYLSGFADRLDNHQPLFDAWTEAGFRVISFDYPSHGDTYGIKNDLNFFTLGKLGKLAKFVEQQTRVDQDRPLYLAGWSTGGLIAARMIQTHLFEKGNAPRVPQGLILFAPGVSVYTLVGDWGKVTQATLTANPSPPHLGPIAPERPALFPVFAASLILNSELARAQQLPKDIPVLVFAAGENEDRYVKTDDLKEWVENQRDQGVQVTGIQCPQARHELDNEPDWIGGPEVRTAAVQFATTVREGAKFSPVFHHCRSF